MKLNFIKTDKCPECGCDIIIHERIQTEPDSAKIREHTNGGRWETREFACGYRVEYCPNFKSEEIIQYCSQAPEFLELKTKRTKALTDVRNFIDALDVDDGYKHKLKVRLSYI